MRRIKAELGVPVMADIATLDEALAAQARGADLVATTLRGYTADTADDPDPSIPHSSGCSWQEPGNAGSDRGPDPHSGTGPGSPARRSLSPLLSAPPSPLPGKSPGVLPACWNWNGSKGRRTGTSWRIDLGGTNTKSGIVSREGELLHTAVIPTPAGGGRQVLLDHLKAVARQCHAHGRGRKESHLPLLGIATAGWVDFYAGRVAYATENLPGWTGTPIAEELEEATGLPVAVENDANALALAEKQFGVGRTVRDFVCLTLGTGVGGGCIIGGSLNRGPHFFANALGHITLVPDGHPCTCGKRGCLETYANAAALLRFAQGAFKTAEEVIAAGQAGDAVAAEAIRILAGHLAAGTVSIIQILDPEMVILSGGIVENNPLLLRHFQE